MLFPVICDYRKEGTGLRAIRFEAKRRKKMREAAWRCALLRLDSLKAFCCVVFAIQSFETREIVTDQTLKSMSNAMEESKLRKSDVRSEERLVGTECGRYGRLWGGMVNKKKKKTI